MMQPRRFPLSKVRPLVERLEDRLTPSWGSTPPATLTPPTSFTSVTLNSSGDATGNASIATTEIDWYRFTASTGGSYIFEATTPSSSLDTVIGTYTSAGSRVGYNDDISSTNRDSRFTVSLTAGQTFFFGVTNYTGTAGGSYTWKIDGPASVTDDAYENNDTLATASNLGTLTASQTYTGLKLADAADYYKFTMNGTGTTANSVSISFTHSLGDIDMRLYNGSGTQVGSSGGTGNSETISLSGLAAGTYTVQVFGYNGALNSGGYSMTINPGTSSGGGGTGFRTLYYNFDGANISRTDWVRWAGSSWNPNDLDAEANGIVVQPFLSTRSDRETIINQIIAYVQADLSQYGITVQRTTGLAVEGQRATTVFWGPSQLSGGAVHVACDIDMGNDNPTDVAFVGNEDWGSAADTALAMADVGLHEAGHTFGLWHVASGTNPESMGLRYNTPQSQWLQNTYFMNQTFNAYVSGGVAHGPGPQNAHQSMLNVFGSGSGAPSGGSGGSTGNLAMNQEDLAHHLANCTPVAHGYHDEDADHDHAFAFADDASEKLAVALLNPAPVTPEPVQPVKATTRLANQDFNGWRNEIMAQGRSDQRSATTLGTVAQQLRAQSATQSSIAPAARQSFESWQSMILNKVRKAASSAAFASVDAGILSLGARADRVQALLG